MRPAGLLKTQIPEEGLLAPYAPAGANSPHDDDTPFRCSHRLEDVQENIQVNVPGIERKPQTDKQATE